MDVPASAIAEGVDDSPISPDQSYSLPPNSNFSRPPRLPLPIEQEDYTPGSPIISSADLTEPVEPVDGDAEGVTRSRSTLSRLTMDEDEPEDDNQDGGLVGEAIGPAVPTVIEWRQSGEKVYVTGTFAAWDRKYRLYKDKHKDALSATINLQPGTHHLKFIVDGDMRLSDELPTAVDFTNILVNYIEVSPDDRPVPVSAHTATGAPVIPPGQTEPIDIKPLPGAAGNAGASVKGPPKKPHRIPTKYYHNVVPKYLLDLDDADGSTAQRRAMAVSETLPAPPSLPLFLSKSVLNGAMPMKDDASVLIMPNHTVLNHLATSSIRQGVLATSATTRYKQKAS
ncbi:hypothetical protein NA57DRAFT_45355 [Rhizodiscina lignyota]|uniref:Association with the SNF1 complex (ASC) domain-containing protein n=1 Tax=Rhizodiscina lignyota TaxID=1504668 RepID=A0A9P4M237_9PEZI|nr:hypothetical protein NA57DRAFT_45355 [Rhizodiscina lignyota]